MGVASPNRTFMIIIIASRTLFSAIVLLRLARGKLTWELDLSWSRKSSCQSGRLGSSAYPHLKDIEFFINKEKFNIPCNNVLLRIFDTAMLLIYKRRSNVNKSLKISTIYMYSNLLRTCAQDIVSRRIYGSSSSLRRLPLDIAKLRHLELHFVSPCEKHRKRLPPLPLRGYQGRRNW